MGLGLRAQVLRLSKAWPAWRSSMSHELLARLRRTLIFRIVVSL